MVYETDDKLIDAVQTLVDDANILVSKFREADVDSNDWCQMWRLYERLIFFYRSSALYWSLAALTLEVESEKDRFLVQKMSKQHIDNFFNDMDEFIEIGKVWKFKDYRAINWQRRLLEVMTNVKETYLKWEESDYG